MSIDTTKGQIEEFFNFSPIWEAIEEELEIWLEEIQAQLENPDRDRSHRDLDRLGGCAEAVRNILDIERVLLTNYDIDHGGSNDG